MWSHDFLSTSEIGQVLLGQTTVFWVWQDRHTDELTTAVMISLFLKSATLGLYLRFINLYLRFINLSFHGDAQIPAPIESLGERVCFSVVVYIELPFSLLYIEERNMLKTAQADIPKQSYFKEHIKSRTITDIMISWTNKVNYVFRKKIQKEQ